MNNRIVEVFRGSALHAEYVSKILEDNGIEYMIRDFMHEGLIAGWVGSVSEESTSVFVYESVYDKAMEILKGYEDAGFDEEEAANEASEETQDNE